MSFLPRGRFSTLWRRQDAVAAIEFALIAPSMLLLLFMGVDVGRYIQATAQMTRMANTMAQLVTSRSAPAGTAVTVADNDMLLVLQSSFVVFPYLLKDASIRNTPFWNDITVVVSSISFMPGPLGCAGVTCTTYTPKVVWSSPIGSSTPRSCTASITSTPDATSPSITTLPTDAYPIAGTGAAGTPTGNIVVVDIAYAYQSIWSAGSMLTLPMPTIKRSVFVAPRYTIASQNGITYTGGSWFSTICP